MSQCSPAYITLIYSGNHLDLHSASEDEEGAEVDEETPEVDSSEDSDTEKPVVSRTLTVFLKPEEATSSTGGVIPVVDDSETESESEGEPVVQPPKRKSPSSPQFMPPSKRKQTPPAEGML